ncbi:hypothetical protein HN385_01890 [archaeon]|jgi:nicotinic acid mononucleotide adenylyltransferase|nr:hypothetical protein [archaeon]MBT3451299.1 hypothetical protein [archaeon]MBT6869440.1 hypothetical protein [archaeon]MBT7192603.1 hypothetical protein [archaeon]MBT7380679.1 hypothetical protein [archaeon]
MNGHLDISEVARSLQLFNLGLKLQEEAKLGKNILEHVRESYSRDRNDVSNLVVALGSYDPLSIAHESLFLRGLNLVKEKSLRFNELSLNELLIVTSTLHFNKKVDFRKNSAIYDRIHSLEGFASCYENVGLALFNKPLFVDLADAIEQKYYPGINIYFLVGSDVMEKVIDPLGYASRGLDSEEIFSKLFKHHFIVSERKMKTNDGEKVVSLSDLLDLYGGVSKYEHKMIHMELQDSYEVLEIPIEDVSSTLIRNRRSKRFNTRELEAVGISDFIDKRGLYLKDDLQYAAFTCARERFAIENRGKPIATYIRQLMNHLEEMNYNKNLQDKELRIYEERSQK